MTISSRLDVIRLFAFGMPLLLLPAISQAQQRPPLANQLAKTYGLDSFGQIEGIRFTFKAELPGLTLYRSWEWHPKTDTVSYARKREEGKPIKVTYPRSQLGSQSAVVKNVIDPDFINDEYWLLLPLHLVWDGSATVTDEGMHKLPLGSASARRIAMKYPAAGGYAPGDTWEFYVGADHRIEEIVYRRGGTGIPGILIATWEDQKRAGPLLVSMDHRGTADGKPVRVSLSDVSVKMSGSESWLNAQ